MSEHDISTETPRRRSYKKLWIWVGSITAAVLLSVALVGLYLAHQAEPMLRKRIVDALSAKFHSPVELDEFHIVSSNGFGVTGKGLRILYIMQTTEEARNRQVPMLTVQQFDFRTSFRGIWRVPLSIGVVHIQGLRIQLPPGEDRASHYKTDAQKEEEKQRREEGTDPNAPKPSIVVGRFVVDDAVLVMETNKPGKMPNEFDIHHLVMHNVGQGAPADFDAILTNPKPIGDIHTSGHFGPWNMNDPHQTPLDGKYTFTNVNMDSIKGIGGHMSAQGTYEGVLGEITSDGETQMQDFSLDISEHPMPLKTKYHAIIDGTTGDVLLQPVEAWLGHSYFTCTGHVIRTKPKGHDILLDVNMPKARIEDMLTLAVKAQPPLMRGGFVMKTQLHIPPGEERVAKKVELHGGQFTITNAVFSSEKIQNKVENMSERAKGKPKLAHDEASEDVTSTMKGRFDVAQSIIQIKDLFYVMPGAQVLAEGVYGMSGSPFEFHGKVRTKATISQMTTSWKSVLLKPVDPFFKKNGAGAEIPFKISGSKDEPHFGLDIHQKSPTLQGTSSMAAPK